MGYKDLYPENWKMIAAQVRQRDDFTCSSCGRSFPPNSTYLHVHHIIPLSAGGSNEPSNLTLLCFECHKDKHEHMQKKKNYRSEYREKKYRPLKK